MQTTIKTSKHQLIGEILLEAGLISNSQLEVALADQASAVKLKIGEILILRGWIKSQTTNFLIELQNDEITKIYKKKYPIGFYLHKAGLLTDKEIHLILEKQLNSKDRFCEIAIQEGFLKEKTANFFLEKIVSNLFSEHNKDNAFIDDIVSYIDTLTSFIESETAVNCPEDDYIDDEQEDTMILAHHISNLIITPKEIIILSDDDDRCFYYDGIAYSSISIDVE